MAGAFAVGVGVVVGVMGVVGIVMGVLLATYF
jgi:hypothetical protein